MGFYVSIQSLLIWKRYYDLFCRKSVVLMLFILSHHGIPDSKVQEAYMGPTWGRQGPGGPHVGPMNLAIGDVTAYRPLSCQIHPGGGVLRQGTSKKINIRIRLPTIMQNTIRGYGLVERYKYINMYQNIRTYSGNEYVLLPSIIYIGTSNQTQYSSVVISFEIQYIR